MYFKLNAFKSTLDKRDYIYEDTVNNLYLKSDKINICDYRKELLPVRDQGKQGTCYAQSAACMKEWQEKKKTYFSPQFIYNNRDYWNNDKLDGNDLREDYGMTGRDIMKILLNKGVCDEKIYPYGKIEKSNNIDTYILNIASKNIIKSYARIESLDGLRNSLIKNGPCLIAFPVYNYKKNFWIKNTHDIFLGGHATTVVGFNDIKKCFIIRNSWGNYWGDNGYCYYHYKDWNSHWECWTTLDNLKNNNETESQNLDKQDKNLNSQSNDNNTDKQDNNLDKENNIDNQSNDNNTDKQDNNLDKENDIDNQSNDNNTDKQDNLDKENDIDNQSNDNTNFCNKILSLLKS